MESSAELIKWVLENLNYWVVEQQAQQRGQGEAGDQPHGAAGGEIAGHRGSLLLMRSGAPAPVSWTAIL